MEIGSKQGRRTKEGEIMQSHTRCGVLVIMKKRIYRDNVLLSILKDSDPVRTVKSQCNAFYALVLNFDWIRIS